MRRSPTWWAATFTLALALLSIPDPLLHPLLSTGKPPSVSWVDGSWIYAQALAASQGIRWGSELLWTHGPYGYLGWPVLVDTGHWMVAVVVAIVGRVALVAAVALLLVRDRSSRFTWVVAAAVLLLPSSNFALDIEALLTATLLLMAALAPGENRPRLLAMGAGALLGLACLIKGTAMGAGVALLVVLGAISRWRRVPAVLESCSAAALLSVIILWWVAGESFADLGLFVRGTLELGAGYPGAMGRLGQLPSASLPALAAGSGSILGVGVLSVWILNRRGYRQTADRAALAMVAVYVQYRNTMVRPSLGSLEALSGVILLLAIPLLTWTRQERGSIPAEPDTTNSRLRALGPSLLVLLSCAELLAVPRPSIVFLADRARGYGHAFELMISPTARGNERLTDANAVRQAYALDPSIIAAARSADTDVMPWDSGLVAGYQLKWDPRPVLQSYSAYTPWLDDRDALFFASSKAPATVIYINESIDGRYPIADEPEAFRVLLNRYRPVVWRGPFLVLRRSEAPTRVALAGAERRCGRAGSWIAIPPAVPDQDVYASVDYELDATGAVMAALLEPPETMWQLRGGWGRTGAMRLVRGNAADGILVTGYASNVGAIVDLWNGAADEPATALRVWSRTAYGYGSAVCVRFTRSEIIRR